MVQRQQQQLLQACVQPYNHLNETFNFIHSLIE